MMTDPIADLDTNPQCGNGRISRSSVPNSKVKGQICRILKRKGLLLTGSS